MRLPARTILVSLVLAAVLHATGASVAQGQQARQGLLSLEDARLFYEVRGEGDPIIVVHGGPGLDHRYLRPGLDVLATHNTLVYYDQRGTGRSATEVGPETVTVEGFVGDIEALREALGLERVHVLTHSFGSKIGVAYARAHPDRVRSLILLNPVDPGTGYAQETQRRRLDARTPADSVTLSELTTSEGYAARDPGTLGRVFEVAFRAAMRDPANVEQLDLDLEPSTARHGQDIAELLGREFGSTDGWAALGEVEAPVLVVHGRHDPLPIEMSTELAESLPDGRLEVLDSGHFPYVEDRNGLLAVVSGFLATLSRL
jgi:proline iminopeptidase